MISHQATADEKHRLKHSVERQAIACPPNIKEFR